MPHTTRERSLRQIRRASDNLDTALEHLLAVKNTYQEPHPEIAETVEAVMELVLQTQGYVKGLLSVF